MNAPRGDDAAPGRAGPSISRRAFVAGALALWAAPWRARAGTPAPPIAGLVGPDGKVVPELAAALEKVEFVYVNPRLADGSPSTCHAEVWFAWLDGTVVTTTARDGWKARAQARGLDRARLWFGNFGRWKSRIAGARNEAFRRGPNFEARVTREHDPALLERVLAVYARKYPAEIGRWRERMRREVASGERVILRYRPLPSPAAAPKPPAAEREPKPAS
ncbi:MAG TPA: hypothetical protein VKB65_01460 [Myxococcota bacterium]|nr:hypothetical protein [Myxococcota bacterium]